MSTGYSGSFGVNGTNFILPPSQFGWSERQEFGEDGGGHPIYSAYRSFDISWELCHPNDMKQILDAYALCSTTGTVSFDLPQWAADGYKFATYSGCTMKEPAMGNYFNEYIQNVKLRIQMVRTN